jgi:hypothetical protein
MSTMEEKPAAALVPPRRRLRRKLHRKQHNVLVYLNEQERAALDRQVERFGVELTTYFRGLIWAVDEGKLIPTDQLFRD